MLELTQLVGFNVSQSLSAAAPFIVSTIHADGSGGNPRTTTVAETIPAGALAVMLCSKCQGSVTLTSMTDSKGNTWTVRATDGGGSSCVGIATSLLTFELVGGVDTVTLTWSGAGNSNHHVLGYITNQTGSPIDKTGTAHGTSAAPSASTAATAQAAEIALGIMSCDSSSPTITEDPAWVNAGSPGKNFGQITVAYKVLSAIAAQTYAPTLSGSNNWAAAVLTLKTT